MHPRTCANLWDKVFVVIVVVFEESFPPTPFYNYVLGKVRIPPLNLQQPTQNFKMLCEMGFPVTPGTTL